MMCMFVPSHAIISEPKELVIVILAAPSINPEAPWIVIADPPPPAVPFESFIITMWLLSISVCDMVIVIPPAVVKIIPSPAVVVLTPVVVKHGGSSG